MTDTTEQTATPETAEPPRYTLLSNEPEAEVTAEVEAEPEQTEEAEPEPEKTKRDANERIRQLNERTKTAEAEAAKLKEDVRRVEAELLKIAERSAQHDKPKPEDFVGGKFNDEYQDALESWRDAQMETRIAQALVERERDSSVQATKRVIQEHEEAFKATHADYSEVIAVALPLFDDPITASAITEIDNITEIAYNIGKDPELLAQLERMTPTQRLIKIGALSVAGQTAQTPAKRVSTAATPITPVSGGSAVLTGAAAIEAAEKSMNYDAWKAAKKAVGK